MKLEIAHPNPGIDHHIPQESKWHLKAGAKGLHQQNALAHIIDTSVSYYIETFQLRSEIELDRFLLFCKVLWGAWIFRAVL